MQYTAGEDLEIYRRVKIKAGSEEEPPEVIYAEAGEACMGVTSEPATTGLPIDVIRLVDTDIVRVTVSEAVNVGDELFGDESGYCYLTPNGMSQFKALEVAAEDGDDIEASVVKGVSYSSGASPDPRIEISSSYIAGYSDATTMEFYLDASDGKAYAGGGNVRLDSNGINIYLSDVYHSSRSIDFVDASDNLTSSIYSTVNTGVNSLSLNVSDPLSNSLTHLGFYSISNNPGNIGRILLYAQSPAGAAQVTLKSTSTGSFLDTTVDSIVVRDGGTDRLIDTNCFNMFAADQNGLAGNSSPHFRSELGGIFSINTKSGTVNSWSTRETVADEAYIDLPVTSNGGWVSIVFGNGEDHAIVNFSSAGVVASVARSANVVLTDMNGYYCVFDGGTSVRVKNRIGTSKSILVTMWY